MSRFRLMLKGSALRTAEAIVAIIAGFITLPLMLHYLGQDLYGFWVLAGSFTGLMYIFDLGFAAAVTRNVTHAISTADHRKANKVINSSLVIYTGLCAVIVLVVILVALFYRPDLSNVISESEFQVVLILLGLTVAAEFPVKAFAGVATAHYRFDLLSIYRIVLKVISTLAIIILLYLGQKIIAIAVVGFVIGAISNVLFFIMAKVIYPNMDISRQYAQKQTMKELFSYSSWAFLIDINQMIKQRIDLFFIGGFISLSAVSVYFVSVRLVEYSAQLLYKMLNIALPVLTNHTAREDKAKFREDLVLFNRMNSYCAAITLSGFILLGEPILYYWMGINFDYQTAYHILIVLLLGRMSALAANAFNIGLLATSQHKLVAKISFAETCLSAISLAIGLGVYQLGAVFAAYAISIPLLVGRLILLPILAGQTMAVERLNSLMISSFRPLFLVPIAYLIDLSLNRDTPEFTWGLVAAIATAGGIGLVFLIFDISARERGLAKRVTPRFLRKGEA